MKNKSVLKKVSYFLIGVFIVLSTVVASGSIVNTVKEAPYVGVEDGPTLIVDANNNRVIVVCIYGIIIWEKALLKYPLDAERLANGNTLITEADDNCVIEVDKLGRTVWEKTDLNYPVDAERLDNGNTLITEANNNRVIEIDNSGTIVWEKTDLNYPVDAERLDNGNTLITEANNNRVIEIDNSGTIVWEEADLNYPTDAERLPLPNDPPNTPSQPSGPTAGNLGVSYSYSTYATDPDDNKVKYYFDWGDETGTWTSLVNSGQPASANHIWSSAGTYQVKAKAQDEHELESDWSPVLTVTIAENKPPDKPSTPSGPSSGEVDKTYIYTTSTTDPEGHQIYYLFDWGDGTESDWSESFNSGEVASVSHTWTKKGDYQVKVKAKDVYGNESVWSDPLPVSMPKNKQSIILLSFEFFNKLLDHFSWLEEIF